MKPFVSAPLDRKGFNLDSLEALVFTASLVGGALVEPVRGKGVNLS